MINGIAEVVLVVRDVGAGVAFYRDLIGLVPEKEPNEAWAWFLMGDPATPQRLALTAGPLLFEEHSPRPPAERWGPVHFALRTTRAEALAAVARLEGAGVAVHGPTRFGWMRSESWYAYDPDGNLAELWVPDD